MDLRSTLSCQMCGQMCDAGYKVIFEECKSKVIEGNIKIDRKIVMQGKCDRETGLWMIQLDNT
jgi:hypothetical protein